MTFFSTSKNHFWLILSLPATLELLLKLNLSTIFLHWLFHSYLKVVQFFWSNLIHSQKTSFILLLKNLVTLIPPATHLQNRKESRLLQHSTSKNTFTFHFIRDICNDQHKNVLRRAKIVYCPIKLMKTFELIVFSAHSSRQELSRIL